MVSDEEVRQVLLALHPAGGRPRGDGWARCVEQRAAIERWPGDGLLLALPLTDDTGTAVLDYLRHGRPTLPTRVLFLRVRPPAGLLKPTAVTEVFQPRARHSGLTIPFQGPHCLRHSLAVQLLREGMSLKAIGDVLGHRSLESTCLYLRLATDDLRDVALDLPDSSTDMAPEVRV